ncbi:uncharacterized protein LOC143034583 [Oratosquilla oratoria]|uniref:uncharacterized protein LOC143034583 n=1 Tax=Oratosquilla oratoria TaxID=337810 RepID=UPI003F7655B4
MSLLSQELLLPITQSSLSFFHDSFFEQRRKHFQMALKEITDRYGFSSPDFLTSYRSLRQRDLKEENQAVSVTDQHNAREIILDVKDFKDGDLSVKAEGHSVEVEGRVEKKEGNSISTHSFRRRFSLPRNVDMASVTSTVSSDGILTIFAPKKNQPDAPNEFNIPIENRTTTSVNINTQESSSENTSSMKSQEKEVTEKIIRDETKNYHNTSDNCNNSTSATEANKKTSQEENQSRERNSIVVEPVTPLPVILRGSFFEDSFFRHAHRDFASAMEHVMKRFGTESSSAENVKRYRTLRDVDFSNETQAFTLSEDDTSFKIVLDAQDFKNGDVQVKIVGESLVVEGRVEKAVNSSPPNLTFQRRFALPYHTDASDITAALSSDGVLTILAKKKCNIHKQSEHIIPIQNESNSDQQNTEQSQEVRSVSQQTSVSEIQSEQNVCNKEEEHARLQQQQLFQQQDNQIQQQAQHIHKQEQMLSEQEDQLQQQKQEIERQKAYNQKLQKDAEELQIKINTNIVDEKGESETTLKQQPLQQDKQQLEQKQKQHMENVQIISIQQEEQIGPQRVHDQKFEPEVEQMQGQVNEQNIEASISNVSDKEVNSENMQGQKTHQAHAHQEETKEYSSIQLCNDDTSSWSDKPYWTPKIGSLETGFLNFKKFECADAESLSEESSSSVHNKGSASVLEENVSSSNTRSETHPETAVDSHKSTVQVNDSFPVERRGNLLQDSLFGNDHKHFQAAISKVLERFGVASTSDNLKAYRTLRQSISVEESQAAQVIDEETSYKVVLDVYEFVGGDVKVKADGQMLVVEGQTQKKENNSTSSRSFRRCFILPTSVDMEAVTSALSSDGVLTITAPKKEEEQGSTKDCGAIPKVKKDVSQSSQTLSSSRTKGWREQTSYHESSFGRGADQQTKLTFQSSSTSGNILGQYTKTLLACSFLNDSRLLRVHTIRGLLDGRRIFHIHVMRRQGALNNSSLVLACDLGVNMYGAESFDIMSLLSQELLLPITQSSLSFFHDSFFEQRRKHFQMALKEITDRHGFSSPDFLTSYRSLRQRDLKEENQAISVTDQHNAREIILDVKDFKDGDLSVKAEGHSVEVEGRVEKKEGNSISTHSFRRRFSLPKNVDMASVTATVSADAILTISAPKKNRPDSPVKNTSFVQSLEKENTETQTKSEVKTYEKTSDSSSNTTPATDTQKKTVQEEKQSQKSSSITVNPVTSLPIMLRGSFFGDSFFSHAHRDFVSAMEHALKRSGAESSTAENFKRYKSLRDVDFSNKTQAYTLSEDDSYYKIVLDAQDFKNGDVQVRLVGESLVVEGRVEKTINNTASNLIFQRRFALPSHTDASDITAALSSDGVLTILAKKKCNNHKVCEHIIPIKNEDNPDHQTSGENQKLHSVSQHNSASEIQSEHNTFNEEKENQIRLQQLELFQQQEKQIQQHDQQIQKQELMISMQEEQLKQHKQEIERQKANNQKLQRDTEELQFILNTDIVNENEESQTTLLQESSQNEKQQLEQEQQKAIQNEQIISLQQQEEIRAQDENGLLRVHTQIFEEDAEETQNQIAEQKPEASTSFAVKRIEKSKTNQNQETEQASTHQDENEVCINDTTLWCNGPVWAPKIGSLETGFSNVKNFECTNTENLLAKASCSVHMEENDSALEEKNGSSNSRTQVLAESETDNQLAAVQENLLLPTEHRGNFFQDSFFENDHKHFQTAISKVLERFGVISSEDNLNAYKTLRQSISVEESQAAQLTDEETSYKVVLDVCEFVGGDVKVKADGQMLVVEGQTQKKEGNSTSSRSFRRCFLLPTLVDMEACTSALSSDGVLTITAPKKDLASTRDLDNSCNFNKEVSRTSQTLSSSSRAKGWREQTSYHESSLGGRSDQQTSRRTFQSSSISGNIL